MVAAEIAISTGRNRNAVFANRFRIAYQSLAANPGLSFASSSMIPEISPAETIAGSSGTNTSPIA